jgi:hypothetical protein
MNDGGADTKTDNQNITFQIVLLGPFVSERNFNTPQLAHGVKILQVYPPMRDGNIGL